jgi:hypothetical protein
MRLDQALHPETVSSMRALRTKSGLRLLVALVATSLLTTLFVPLVGTAHQADGQPYAAWLKHELDGWYDADVFDPALQAATASQPRSFEAVLDAFVPSLLDQSDAAPQVGASAALDVSRAALLRHLYGPYVRLASKALPARTMLADVMSYQGKAPQRPEYRAASHPTYRANALAVAVAAREEIPSFVLPVRLQTAARPLGP